MRDIFDESDMAYMGCNNLPCIKDIITRGETHCWPCGKTRRPHASPSCVVTGRGNPNWLLPSRLALVNRSPTQLVASSNRRRHITPFGIYAEWTRARRHGHTGTGLTQRTSAVYVIWWWWWLSWKGAIVAINHHSGSTLQPRYNARR